MYLFGWRFSEREYRYESESDLFVIWRRLLLLLLFAGEIVATVWISVKDLTGEDRIGEERATELVTRSRIGAVGEESSRVLTGLAILGEDERFDCGGSLDSAIKDVNQIDFCEVLKEERRKKKKLGFRFGRSSRFHGRFGEVMKRRNFLSFRSKKGSEILGIDLEGSWRLGEEEGLN